MTENLLFPLIVSLALSFLFGIPSARLAERLGIIDVPNSAPHKKHHQPTPLAGGFVIAFALIVAIIFFHKKINQELIIVFGGAVVILLFGFWDDAKGLSATPKLVGQLIACALLVTFDVQVHFMTNFAEFGYFSLSLAEVLNIFITFFWVIGITNAFNMIDSMDGIVAGLGALAFAFFMAATNLAGQQMLAFWSAIFLGICISLYYWNKLRSRFFLGDSGSQTIGFLLSSLGILYNPLNRSPESSWIVPIMLLAIPIFDTTLVVLSRFKKKQKVGSGRRDHTYHRLIALKFSPTSAVLITHLASLVISLIAYFTLSLPVIGALIIFFITILFGIAFLLWFERKPTLDE